MNLINSRLVGHEFPKTRKHLVSSHSPVAIMNVPVSHRGSTLVLLFFIVSPSRLLGRWLAVSADGTICLSLALDSTIDLSVSAVVDCPITESVLLSIFTLPHLSVKLALALRQYILFIL